MANADKYVYIFKSLAGNILIFGKFDRANANPNENLDEYVHQ